jgi:hypothetical protein
MYKGTPRECRARNKSQQRKYLLVCRSSTGFVLSCHRQGWASGTESTKLERSSLRRSTTMLKPEGRLLQSYPYSGSSRGVVARGASCLCSLEKLHDDSVPAFPTRTGVDVRLAGARALSRRPSSVARALHIDGNHQHLGLFLLQRTTVLSRWRPLQLRRSLKRIEQVQQVPASGPALSNPASNLVLSTLLSIGSCKFNHDLRTSAVCLGDMACFPVRVRPPRRNSGHSGPTPMFPLLFSTIYRL